MGENMASTRVPLDSSRVRFSDEDIQRRLKLVDLRDEDVSRILSIREPVIKKVDEFTAAFFSHLSRLGEVPVLFSTPNLLEEAKRLKREHLLAAVNGTYDRNYIEQRLKLGKLYSSVGLDVQAFLGAFHHLMRTIGAEIMKAPGRSPIESFEAFLSLKKVGFLDIGVIVDVLIDEREITINQQQEAIRELSTPVLQVRDRLLIMPIIGVLDSRRAKQLTDGLLQGIRSNRAKVVVIDITGVAAVDSKVANHLIQTVAAARLMGTAVIVTGLSAEVAQALVALGVDLSKVNTVGDLQGGLEEAERLLGYRMSSIASETMPRAAAGAG